MKVLILYTDAGGGHKSVSNAVKYILETDHTLTVTTINFYKEIISSKGEDVYNSILKLNLAKWYWRIVVRPFRLYLWLFNNYFIQKVKNNLTPLLHDHNIIISVIPFFNSIINNGLKKANYTGKFIIFPTDFSNPYQNYWFANCDEFILNTKELVKQHLRSEYCKINAFAIDGLPLRTDFYSNKLTHELASTKPKFDIKILLMFGKSPGTKYVYTLLDFLLKNLTNSQLVVICGENKKLFDLISKLHNNDLRIKHYMYVSDVVKLIDDSNIVISKPGPTTICEAAIRGKYLLVQNDSSIMNHEKYNITYVVENNLGDYYTNHYNLLSKLKNYTTHNVNHEYVNGLNSVPSGLLGFIKSLA